MSHQPLQPGLVLGMAVGEQMVVRGMALVGSSPSAAAGSASSVAQMLGVGEGTCLL